MIQFNLLPDVKLNYIKAQRVKGLVLTISLIVTGVTVGLMLIAAVTVYGIQKKQLSDTSDDITAKSNELKNTKDIDKILTIQNQLNTIASLHEKKPVASRLFGFLSQLTPTTAKISDLTVDYSTGTMIINGNADSYQAINEFADTLKYASYTVEGVTGSSPAFKSIVTTINGASNAKAGYGLTFTFAPELFDITKKVSLVVPDNKITTRSVTEKPGTLFDVNPDAAKDPGGQ